MKTDTPPLHGAVARWLSVLLGWVMLAWGVPSDAQAVESACEAAPAADEFLVQRKLLFYADVLSQQGRVEYAGDEANPRPLPNKSFADWVDVYNADRDRALIDPATHLYIGFRNARLASGRDESVPLSTDRLWCLVERGDTVLIGQGDDPHYTTVGRVDRVGGRIAFADRWPERFPLLPDRAEIVRVEGYKLVETSRAWFTRSVVGVIKLVGADALRNFAASQPGALEPPAVCFGFGQSYLRAGADGFVPDAAKAYRCARRAARDAGDAAMEARAVNRLHFALLLDYYLRSSRGEGRLAEDAYREAESLRTTDNRTALIDSNSAADFERLGRAAMANGSKGASWADSYLSEALARDPNIHSALVLRARHRLNTGRFQASLDDTMQAGSLIIEDHNAARRDEAQLDPRDLTGRNELDRRLKSHEIQMDAVLRTRAYAGAKLNLPDVVQPIIRLLRKRDPKESWATYVEGILHRRRACPSEAALAFNQALQQDPPAALRSEIERELSELSGDGRDCVPQ